MFHYTPLENTQLIIYSQRVNQNIQKLLSCLTNILISWRFVMIYLLITVRITLNTQILHVTRSSFLMSQHIIHKISNGLEKVNLKSTGFLIKKKNIEFSKYEITKLKSVLRILQFLQESFVKNSEKLVRKKEQDLK
jgi:hypothetical protein